MTLAARLSIALLVFLSACQGCGPVVDPPNDFPLLFIAPLSGDRITRDDDVSEALDGIQIDVQLSTVAPADTVITLIANGVELNAAAGSGDVLFSSVTLGLGAQTLTARAGATEIAIDVFVVDEGSPCEFVAPRDGELLGVTDDVDNLRAGMQSDVTISCEGFAAGTQVFLGLKDRRKNALTLDATGRAVLSGVDLAEGPNTLHIENENGAALGSAVITVDTGACIVEIVPGEDAKFLYDPLVDAPGGTLTPLRDLQVKTSCENAAVALTIVGSVFDATTCTTTTTTVLMDETQGAVRTFSGTTLPQGDLVVSATVTEGDLAGRALPNNFHVDTYAPRLVSVTPDDGAIVDVVDDDPALPGFQITVRGQAIGLEAGAIQSLRVTDELGNSAQYETEAVNDSECFNQTSDRSTFEWSGVALSDGLATLELTIRDALGNTQTQTIVIAANTAIPTLVITKPAGLPTLLTLVDDADPAPGMQVDFELDLSGVPSPSGLAGALALPGQAPQFFTFTTSPQPLRVSLEDGLIEDGFAAATLLDGRVIQSQLITFEIDGTPPFLAELSPREGDVIAAASVNVSVSLQTELQDREIRLLVDGAVVQTETITAASVAGDPLMFAFGMPAALAMGANALSVEVDDRAGAKKNTSTLPLSVFRVTGMPTIAFTGISGASGALPAPPMVLQLGPTDLGGDLTDGFDVRAAAQISAAPGQTLIALSITDLAASAPSGTVLSLVRTVEDTGTLSLSDIDFSLWANEDVSLWLTMTEAVTGATATTRLNVRVELPTANDASVKIVSPSARSQTNTLAYAVAIATDASLVGTAKTCTLTLDGVDAAVSTFSVATATFSGTHASLSDGTHVYHVTCTAGAKTFFSQRVPFSYRSAAPTISFVDSAGVSLVAPSGAYFNALAIDSLASAGYQHDVDVATDQPDGTLVTLRVDAVIVGTAQVLTGVAHFRDVTLLASDARPAGATITLAASVDDAFGFGTLTVSRSVLLDLVPPTVTLASGACPASIDLNNPFDLPSFDAIEWSANVATSGLANGATVTTRVTQPSGTTTVSSSVASNGSTPRLAFAVPAPPSVFSVSFVTSGADAAENIGTSATCSTVVNPSVPSVSFSANGSIQFVDNPGGSLPVTQLNSVNDQNAMTAGIQVSFTVTVRNVAGGAAVSLCSTASDPLLNSAPACSGVPGKVLASGTSSQPVSGISNVLFTNVSLVDALVTPYGLAVEVLEPGTGRRVVSPLQQPAARSFSVLVDSRDVPTFVSLSSTRNIAENDRTGVVVLGKRVWRAAASAYDDEGNTAVAGLLDPGALVFTMSGATNVLSSATLQSNLQTLNATPSFNANTISFTGIGGLQEGLHTLTLNVALSSGNARSFTTNVFVDVTLPVVVVGQATDDPYVCPTGSCTSAVLPVSVQVDVSDNNDLLGGCGCARLQGDAPCLNAGTLCGSHPVFAAGVNDTVVESTSLAQGANTIVAEAADAAGNVGVSAAPEIFNVDSLAVDALPAFELSATAGSCATFAARCSLAPYDQGATACQDNYPASGTDPGVGPEPSCARWYKSGVYRVGTTGTTSTACALGGDCSHVVRLIGTPLDSSGVAVGAPVDVFLSSKTVTGDIAAGTLLETIAPAVAPGLDRSNNWSLVLEARDVYGNFSRSPARFATLPSFGGALVSLAYVTGGTGAITSNSYFGVRHNKNATSAPFVSDLAVNLTWTSTPPAGAPRCLELIVDGGAAIAGVSTATVTGPETVTFSDVTLPVGGPFTLQAQVRDGACSGGVIAAASLTGLRSVITQPTVDFQCAWRQAAGFNTNCALAPAQVLAVAATGTTGALVDRYAASPGFQFTLPPVVDVSGADGGTVSLASDIATLTGTVSRPVGASGSVSFDDTLTIPTVMLPGSPATTRTHAISVRACNVAGDCVTGPQTLPIKANADPPAQVGVTTVCTGQTTGPFADAAACAALCSASTCDRRAGKAIIAFTAPGANAGTVASVAGYDVAVAIVDETLADYEARCNALVLTGTTRPSDLLVPVTVQGGLATPGNQQVLAIANVPLHQRVCVAARAKDDVGNASAPRSAARVNLLDPVTTATQTFVRTSGDAERPLEDDVPMTTLPISLPRGAIAVGDMDGDGGIEFAIAGADTDNANVETVFVYSSKRTRNAALPTGTRFSPREVITAPPSGAPGFGVGSLAGGDFNGDGFADLAIGHAGANLPSGSGGGGAVYIYYGAGNAAAPGDTNVIADATCALGNVPARNAPSTVCPQVILSMPAGHFFGWALASGHITTAVPPTDPRKALLTYPSDLLVGDASVAVHFARRALFPATATTVVFDFSVVNANVTAITSDDFNDFLGTSVAAADLNGDQLMDIVVGNDGSFFGSAHSLYFFDAAVLPATPTNQNAPRCDVMTSATLRALNLANVGHLSGTSDDWLLAHVRDDLLQGFQGSSTFFAVAAGCTSVASRSDAPALSAALGGPLAPIRRFGPSLDDGCNVVTATKTGAVNMFDGFFGAAGIGDFDGDGSDDFMVGQPGALGENSRTLIVSYAPRLCGSGNHFRVVAELTGNTSTSGLGTFVFNAGLHAGGTRAALGTVGTDLSSPTRTLVNIYR
jgi:hypothetical protein